MCGPAIPWMRGPTPRQRAVTLCTPPFHRSSACGDPCFQTWGGSRRSFFGAGEVGFPLPLDNKAVYMIYFLYG